MRWFMLIAVGLSAALAGCGITPKVELEGFALWDKPREDAVNVRPEIFWARKIGRGGAERYAKLRPELEHDELFIADRDGWVTAYDSARGKSNWVRHYPVTFRSGPHVVGDLIYLGTNSAEVYALARADGHLVWHSSVSSEVLSPPQAHGDWVVVQTVDGRVYGLRSRDGQRVWTYDRTVPVLSLRGTSTPLIVDDKVIIGFDNGKLVALALADGKLLWEQAIATAQGRTDLERMVDIDGDLVADGLRVYAVSYQGKVAALTLDSGRVEWSRDMSSYFGPILQDTRLFVVDEKGVLWSLDRESGTAVWRQDMLRGRASTSVAVQDGVLAVGTRDGAVYWFQVSDGAAVGKFHYRDIASKVEDDGRITTTNDPLVPEDLRHVYEEFDVVASPVAAVNRLFVSYRNGAVVAVGLPKGVVIAR